MCSQKLVLVMMIGVCVVAYAKPMMRDPTQRPAKLTMDQAAMKKRYPVDLVIVGKHNKILKIGNKNYTVGDHIDDMKIMDIKMDKVLLQDGRHGYMTMMIQS